MKNVSMVLMVTLGLIAITGCAEKVERAEVSKDVAAEPQPASRADLRKESEDLIDRGQFTADQKAKLHALHSEMVAKSDALSAESLRIRSLLLKEVIAKKGDPLEISVLEDKLRDNSNQRLKLIFDSVKKTNAIIGRNSIEQDRLRIFDDIIMKRSDTY